MKSYIKEKRLCDIIITYRQEQYNRLKGLLSMEKWIAETFEEDLKTCDVTPDNLGKNILKSFESPDKFIEKIKKIEPYSVSGDFSDYYYLKFNQIGAINEKVVAILDDEEKISNILKGDFLERFDQFNIERGILPILIDQMVDNFGIDVDDYYKGRFCGSSKPTILSQLFKVIISFIDKDSNFDEKNYPTNFYSVPLQDELISEDTTNLLYFKDRNFIFPHSGYGFGGSYNKENAKYKPLDCSNFVRLVYDLHTASYSTPDLYLIAQYDELNDQLKEKFGIWATEYDALRFDSLKKVSDREAEFGDIVVSRKFDATHLETNSLGYSGHAGLFLYKDSDYEVTLALNRNIPSVENQDKRDIEGYGLEIRNPYMNLKDDEEIKEFYLEPTDKKLEELENTYSENTDLQTKCLSYITSVIDENQLCNIVGAIDDDIAAHYDSVVN